LVSLASPIKDQAFKVTEMSVGHFMTAHNGLNANVPKIYYYLLFIYLFLDTVSRTITVTKIASVDYFTVV